MAPNDVITRFHRGDKSAFEEIHHKFFPLTYGIAKSYVGPEQAKDAVQTAFISLWENREGLKTVDHIKFWLITTIRNICISILRAETRLSIARKKLLDANNEEANAHIYHIEIQSELLQKIEAAVTRLPARYQKIFDLAYKRQWSDDQIADILNISKKSVTEGKSRLHHEVRQQLLNNGELSLGMMLLGMDQLMTIISQNQV
ncbi:sigma-70 family RNA polymerase sigma factor [Chitinophaga lutea]|uniref:Sigma-70 family RNA polymerase sigma factor n=1 Tax=Chitinophaga lutea TaxID=2488634 RepID=A0A3N4PWI4_9BACT|nr:sigma-70 family RNA polymerase sigma factor [Chitinophaga lutea]RPE13163.1 sigma-70 family RNA polymerase sigma factor [Chitinophaga lutea]